MAQQAQQPQSGGDNSLAPVWITVLVFFFAYAIWRAAHQYIVAFIFYLNIYEAKLINLVLQSKSLELQIYNMQTIDPAAVSWDQLMEITEFVGNYIRYPILGLLIILAIVLYRSNITLKFRKTYDMRSLRKQEQYNWPAIMPVIKEDLVNEDIDKGPWAMAMTPMEFARKHQLLRKDDVLLDNATPGLEMTAGIRRGDAKRVFTLQLGPYWEDFSHCPAHVMALAAVFMARINRDREAASHILLTLDKTYVEGKPHYAVALPTLRKYQNTELVQEAIQGHAYLLTVMASLLQASRNDGVVPTAEFIWLKPVDRRLWYMLNCVGRQTPFVEVAGPFAHWLAEKEMKRHSLLPMIDEAIKALESAVKEVKLSPKELRELKP